MKSIFRHQKNSVEIKMLQIDLNNSCISLNKFRWNDRVHGGGAEPFYIWVEDPINHHIYHHEYLLLTKKQVLQNQPQEIVFTIPIFEPLPEQYYIRAISDRWLGSETYCAISFKHLILPERHPPHTNLLDLQPLPVSQTHDICGFRHYLQNLTNGLYLGMAHKC